MTDPQPEALEPVEQVDRDAAADSFRDDIGRDSMFVPGVRDGQFDDCSRVQAFYRHRRRASHPTEGPRADDVERPGAHDDCRAVADWSDDDVEQLVHELSYELEVAELDRNDYVTVNRAKLTTIAKRVLARAALRPTPPSSMGGSSGEGLRPEVLAFAHIMEAQLRANDHKPGWKDDCSSDLVIRIREETDELNDACDRLAKQISWGDAALYLESSRANLAREAADVANFAMMVADVSGVLPTPPTNGAEA